MLLYYSTGFDFQIGKMYFHCLYQTRILVPTKQLFLSPSEIKTDKLFGTYADFSFALKLKHFK